MKLVDPLALGENKLPRHRRGGALKDILHPALLDDTAFLHNGNAGAYLLDDAHFVGDDNNRYAKLFVDLL